MGTDLEKCSITLLAHQWILCSEWVPPKGEPKQLIKTSQSTLVLGDMVIFHIVISPACEIADTRYYRAWVGVGKRETLCTCHKLFHNYLVILNRRV